MRLVVVSVVLLGCWIELICFKWFASTCRSVHLLNPWRSSFTVVGAADTQTNEWKEKWYKYHQLQPQLFHFICITEPFSFAFFAQFRPHLCSIKGPTFPESVWASHFPYSTTAVHTRCKHEMIPGRAKKNLRKIKCEQNGPNPETLPVLNALSGRKQRSAGQQKHGAIQGPDRAESLSRCN